MTNSTPASVPRGLFVSLHRARIKPGQSAEADRWMRMHNDRLDESIATLERERMSVEIVFRLADESGDYLYWVTVRGKNGASVETSEHQLDEDHLAFDKRVREPGWITGTVELLLLPDAVRDAVLAWSVR
jgi:hypothetical protein